MSPEVPSWGIKLIVPAVGAMLALSAALAAACFVKAFGVTFLGRPRTTVAAGAHEIDRASLAAMFIFAGLCLLVGILPGLVIDALAPVVQGLVGRAACRCSPPTPWLSIVPIAESRSSYNGLLVFVFITMSTLAAVEIIHRFASRACAAARPGTAASRIRARPRNTPPTASPSRSAACSAKSCSWRASGWTCRRPATCGPARLTVTLRDLVWDAIYAPVGGAIWFAADKLSHLQFLTIRQYLSLVFALLVVLLFVLMLVMLVWT